MTTIAIIEDNETLRISWYDYLISQKSISRVYCFESVVNAIASHLLPKCEIVLLDIQLPEIDGIKGIPLIFKENPELHILMISIHNDDEYIYEALKAGAVGYLEKNISPDELMYALQLVIEGGSPISPFIANKVVNFFTKIGKDDIIELTEREKVVLELLAEGATYKSIAEQLFLSLDGVRYHTRNIYYKLQVNNKAEAVSIAIRRRLI